MLFGYDFYFLWCAGGVAANGGNPYSAAELNKCLATISWPASEGVYPLNHPSHNFWLYCLLAYLPFSVSLILWSLISAGLCVWSGLQWLKLEGLALYKNSVLLSLLILVFPPILGTLVWGQVNALHFFGVTCFAVLYHARRYLFAGILLSLTIIKPHLYLCTYAYLALVIPRQRSWWVYCGAAFGLIAQVLLSQIFFQEGWQLYLKRLSYFSDDAVVLTGATLAQQLANLTGWGGFCIISSVFALLAGARLGVREHKQLSFLPLTLGVSLIFAPYCWSHGLVSCLPLFLPVMVGFIGKLSERQILGLVLGVACASIPLIVNAQSQIVWMLMPFFTIYLANKRVNERCGLRFRQQ